MTPTLSLPLVLALACGPKEAPPPVAAAPAVPSLEAGPPQPGPASAWVPPQPQRRSLSTGSTLWVLEQPGLPLVSLRVIVPGGRASDPADQPGLASLADDMLLRGAGDRDAQAFAAAMDQLALDLWVSTGDVDSTIGLDAHADRLEEGLALLADAALRPRFEEDEVARMVELRQGDLAVALTEPRTIGRIVLDRTWYGQGHLLADPAEGTPASVATIAAEDVQSSWKVRRELGAPIIVAVGDVQADALAASLEQHLADWSGDPAPRVTVPEPAAPMARVMVDNPGAAQSMLMLAMPAPAQADPQVEAARLGATVLGGTFTSRLNRKLREEKGYTYGARAWLDDSPDHGRLVIATAVQRDVTGPALTDLLAELERFHGDLAEAELDKARGALRTDLIDMAGSRQGLASSYAAVAADGRSPDSLAARLEAQATVGAAGSLAALDQARLDQATVVVVGDLEQIHQAVQEALPGDWLELDALGLPVE